MVTLEVPPTGFTICSVWLEGELLSTGTSWSRHSAPMSLIHSGREVSRRISTISMYAAQPLRGRDGRLRAMGVRRRLVAPQRRRSGWDSITDSKLAVARLVAQGRTNRETAERLIVSRHTVSG